jgi:hypothetical protein
MKRQIIRLNIEWRCDTRFDGASGLEQVRPSWESEELSTFVDSLNRDFVVRFDLYRAICFTSRTSEDPVRWLRPLPVRRDDKRIVFVIECDVI